MRLAKEQGRPKAADRSIIARPSARVHTRSIAGVGFVCTTISRWPAPGRPGPGKLALFIPPILSRRWVRLPKLGLFVPPVPNPPAAHHAELALFVRSPDPLASPLTSFPAADTHHSGSGQLALFAQQPPAAGRLVAAELASFRMIVSSTDYRLPATDYRLLALFFRGRSRVQVVTTPYPHSTYPPKRLPANWVRLAQKPPFVAMSSPRRRGDAARRFQPSGERGPSIHDPEIGFVWRSSFSNRLPSFGFGCHAQAQLERVFGPPERAQARMDRQVCPWHPTSLTRSPIHLSIVTLAR